MASGRESHVPWVHPTTPSAYSSTALADGSSRWNCVSSAYGRSTARGQRSSCSLDWQCSAAYSLARPRYSPLPWEGGTYVHKDISWSTSSDERFRNSRIDTTDPQDLWCLSCGQPRPGSKLKAQKQSDPPAQLRVLAIDPASPHMSFPPIAYYPPSIP